MSALVDVNVYTATVFSSGSPHDVTLAGGGVADVTQTVIYVTAAGGDNTATSMPMWELLNATTVRFTSTGGSTTFAAVITVVEHDSDMDVQHMALNSDASTSQTISTVDQANAFIIGGGFNTSSSSIGGDELTRLYFISDTSVGIEVDTHQADSWRYQVVHYAGCDVTVDNHTFHESNTTESTTHGSIDTDVTAIFMTASRGSDGGPMNPGEWWIPSSVPTATGINWIRGVGDAQQGVGGGRIVTIYLVEYTDGTVIQNGVISAAAASGTATPSAFDETESVVVGCGEGIWSMCQGGRVTGSTSNEEIDTIWVKLVMDDTVPEIAWSRTTNTETLKAYWQLIEFSTGAAATGNPWYQYAQQSAAGAA